VQGRCPSVKLRGDEGRRPLAPEDGSEALVERRLAAILAADAVGYSRLMRKDEPGALALLHKHRSEVIDPATPSIAAGQ
jgi:class 3 adenylate cyclase